MNIKIIKFDEIKKLIIKKLSKLSFKDKLSDDYYFKIITDCDSYKLLKIRNNSRVLKMMTNQKPISLTEHAEFLSQYSELKRMDFVIISKKTNDYIGSVYLTYINYELEIGKYIGDENYLNRGLAQGATKCIIKAIKKIDKSQEIFSKTRSNNKININLNKKLGFKIIKEDEKYVTMILK